jgi:putative peptidoglycan lipid II flippase
VTVPSADTAKPRQSVIRSSMIYSGLTLVSRFMGFLRDLVVGYRIGASATAAGDAYNTALAFPNLFRRIFAEGAFAAAFVPAYSKSLEANGEEVADKLAADAMATLAAATIGITLVFDLSMPWVMHLINPGYTGMKYKLSVIFTQISMPYLPCMAIVAHLSGVLNARGRFILSAAAPTLLNLMMLIFILPQKTPEAAALWASIGTVAAGVAQGALLTWGVHKSGAKVHWRLPRLTPEVKQLIMLAIPGAIAASATQPGERRPLLAGDGGPALSAAVGPGRGGHRGGALAAPVAGGARR